MKHVLFSLLLFAFWGCQIDALDPLNTRTVVPDLNARVTRKLAISSDGKTIYNETRYIYTNDGRLGRMDNYSRNADGQLSLLYYETFEYDANGSLARKTAYNRSSSTGGFSVGSYTVYTYPVSGQTDETVFYRTQTNVYDPLTLTKTFSENGVVTRVERFGFNNKQTTQQNSTTYVYQAGRLTTEELKDAAGKSIRMLQYRYKGRSATVETVGPNSSQSFVQQELQYDRRGRLIRQQYVNYYLSPGLYYSLSTIPQTSLSIFEYGN